MAETPLPVVDYRGEHAASGVRWVEPRLPDPDLGDDFNWRARDYDAIRIAMIEELAARLPQHARWSPADLEVVLVEALAAALDQLADMADRIAAEAVLETARRPESVRRLLGLIGYDTPAEVVQTWSENPALMEQARRAGPLAVHVQRRMVAIDDFNARIEEHPAVARASAQSRWSGAWTSVQVAVILRWPGAGLDTALRDTAGYDADARSAIEQFHAEHGLDLPDVDSGASTTLRLILDPLIEAYRMLGQPVELRDAVAVGIEIEAVVEVSPNYFRSELRQVLTAALGHAPGAFFAPERIRLGEDLHASDLYQLLLGFEGVTGVRLTRFKRIGERFPDHAADGLIRLDGIEVPVCDNDSRRPERGRFSLDLRGGRLG